ncbi:Ribosome maturation factor RimP N-terminal [Arabidopsis thaliana x Arabidopsis arenosa]|uniref:Ribosome maturation factor RimP N-terminal n=1 Tax=Arabidopsis thaliana x Arabidopsis arenosa TaxID=1240361 RepID=A0A8T2BHR1_9BRAS|nr:Ribosome maturation factor RimP N-terminal [Arabidopsis thaliana x Arabidopsis arenosa]
MVRYQSLSALFRASRRLTSPATCFSVRQFSSSLLLPKTTPPRYFPFSSSISRFSSSSSSPSPSVRPPKSAGSNGDEEDTFEYKTTDDVEVIEDWEEEEDEEVESYLGDGGDGGGIVLRDVPWGEKVLSIAAEVLKQSEEELELFAFKTSPRGYIYVRLDKLSNEYGCPTMDKLEEFSREFKKRLDDAGAAKLVPEDLALEVSSPGAERLLRVPEDLPRFKEMPMTVSYVEETNSRKVVKTAVFLLESIDAESDNCVWKLADVKENRDPESKGRPLSRKQKDLRITLPFTDHKKINLYLD